MDSLHGAPALVLSGRLEILGANALGRALFSPVYADREGTPSNARFVFLDREARTFFRDWDTVANDPVAILRAEVGRNPHDRDLSDLVGSSPPAVTSSGSDGPPTTSASTPPA
jgi:hypothetical protein